MIDRNNELDCACARSILCCMLHGVLPEEFMFPKCANLECSASFGKLREGILFRFHRGHAAGEQANSHSVEHAWLCAKCCETHTLEYRENRAILVPLAPPVEVAPVPALMRKRSRRPRSLRRRPRSSRAPAQNSRNNPVMLLAITPNGDFIDRT